MLLTELSFDPTIILVSETWISDSKPFIFSLKKYSFINQSGIGKGGGAGIFIKNNINYTQSNDYKLNLTNCEDLWIKINISPNKTILVSSFYRHPSYDIQTFEKLLLDKIVMLNNSNINFILGGDININLLSNSKNITNYNNNILAQGTLQLVKSPTRLHGTTTTLIDHFYTNIPEEQTQTDTLIFDISDHLPIITFLNPIKLDKQRFKRKLFRDLKNINYTKFNEDLKHQLEKIPFQNSNLPIQKLWDLFEDTLNTTLNKHAPEKFQSRKQHKKSLSPWITNEILLSIKTKRKLYKKAIKNPCTSNWSEFKSHRNKLTRLIEQSKRGYYQSEIAKVKSNPQKIWKTLNNIINIKKNINTANEIKLRDETNNSIINDPKEISNKFNQFFTTIGSKLSQQINTPAIPHSYNKLTQLNMYTKFLLFKRNECS